MAVPAQLPAAKHVQLQRVAESASREARALNKQTRRTNAAFAELRETLAELGIRLIVDDLPDTEENTHA